MGTRALITKNGKPFIATHWDGDPEELGGDLLGNVTDEDIIQVAVKRSIDAIDSDYEKLATHFSKIERQEAIKKAVEADPNATISLVKSLNPIEFSDIKHYGDFAEWHYDLRWGRWYARPISGEFPESFDTLSKLQPLETVIENIIIKADLSSTRAKMLTQRLLREKKRVGHVQVKSHTRKTKKGRVAVRGHVRVN